MRNFGGLGMLKTGESFVGYLRSVVTGGFSECIWRGQSELLMVHIRHLLGHHARTDCRTMRRAPD